MRQQLLSAFVFVTAGVLLIGSSLPSAAQVQVGPYVSADIGAAFPGDISGTFGNIHGKLTLDTGIRAGVAVGYTLYSSATYETAVQFETGVVYNPTGDLSADGVETGAAGDFYQVPFLADIIYRFRLGERWVPYLGIGGGAVYSRLHLDHVGDLLFDHTDDSFSPALQATGGINYMLDEKSEIGIGYKYLADFAGVDYVGTHSFSLVYRYRF